MQESSRRKIINQSIKLLSSLFLLKKTNAQKFSGLSTTNSDLLNRPIIVRTKIFSNIYPDKSYYSTREFWKEHPHNYNRFQAWVKNTPFFAKRVSQNICTTDGIPIYENYYSSLESYLNHIKLIVLMDKAKIVKTSNTEYQYHHNNFRAEDTIRLA